MRLKLQPTRTNLTPTLTPVVKPVHKAACTIWHHRTICHFSPEFLGGPECLFDDIIHCTRKLSANRMPNNNLLHLGVLSVYNHIRSLVAYHRKYHK